MKKQRLLSRKVNRQSRIFLYAVLCLIAGGSCPRKTLSWRAGLSHDVALLQVDLHGAAPACVDLSSPYPGGPVALSLARI
jgi:hypothetical protein